VRDQGVDDDYYMRERILASDTGGGERSTATAATVADGMRQAYLLHSYMSNLSSVKWLPVSQEMQQRQFPIKARKGHNSCVLNGPDGFKSLVITGGFSDDEGVTLLRLQKGIKSHTSDWGWTRLTPRYSSEPIFVYGASLTSLPAALSTAMERDRFMKDRPGLLKKTVAKAIRFGGFKGGRYTNPTNELWVLTIVDYDYEDGTWDQFAAWDKIETNGFSPRARAFHSATLIHERWLVVIGGMANQGSCLEESILDTKTWKWVDMSLGCECVPSGRHGHSVIWDKRRDRLVMFGGGSGTDLLRSGCDNNEIWELRMTMPGSHEQMWEWLKLRKNTLSSGCNNDDSGDDDSNNDSDSSSEEDEELIDAAMNLSSAESLCLGRCHNAMKLSPDTVLLMFGGGRPSTNGMLGYDLSKDAIIRPRVNGPLPMPRFTGVASLLETEGYILVHGGFNKEAQGGSTILDMNVLDLAPALRRNFAAFPLDEGRESQDAVSDDAAGNGQYGSSSRAFLYL